MTPRSRPWFTALIALAVVHSAGAAEPAAPAQCCFPPEFVLHEADAIGLSEPQRQQISAAMQQAQAVVQQAQTALMTTVCGVLSPDQQRDLATLQPRLEAFVRAQHEAQLRQMQVAMEVQAKMAQLAPLIQAQQQRGGDLSTIQAEMNRMQAAESAGQVDQVVAILDGLLAALAPR